MKPWPQCEQAVPQSPEALTLMTLIQMRKQRCECREAATKPAYHVTHADPGELRWPRLMVWLRICPGHETEHEHVV